MLKKTVAMAILWVAAVSLMPLCAIPGAQADSEAVAFEQASRHVAVVYDDSGSMYFDPDEGQPLSRWYQANYMLQTFCALMSDRDELFITYMSEPDGHSGNVLEGGRDEALEAIRGWRGFVNRTPFAAVETAYAHLKGLDKPTQDEYWLVVMTDGDFNDFSGDPGVRLHEMIDEMAALSRTLKVVFFAIGEDVSCPDPDLENGLLVYRTDSDGIVATMARMSDLISARQRISEEDLVSPGGNALTFTTRIPVRSIVVYMQGSPEPVRSASGPGGALELSSSSGIAAPEPFRLDNGILLTTDANLAASVTHVTSESGMLDPGEYTLTLGSGLAGIDCRVLYEPAVGIRLRYLVNGMENPLPKSGEFVDIEAVLVDAGGNAFDPLLLETPVRCRLQEIRDGQATRTVEGFMLDNVRLVDGRVSVVWEAAMDGYFTVRGRMNYEAPAPGETAASTPAPGETPAPGDDAPPLSLAVGGTLMDQTIPLRGLEDAFALIGPLYRGRKPTAEQAASGKLEVECLYSVEFDVEFNQDESAYRITPRYYAGNSLITTVGPVQMIVQYTAGDGTTVTQTISFTIQDIPGYMRYGKQVLIPGVLVILSAMVMGILFFRRKFPRENAWIEYRQMVRSSKGQWTLSLPPSRIELTPMQSWRLIPFAPERINAAGLIIKAGKTSQSVMVDKRSLRPGTANSRGPLPASAFRSDYEMNTGTELFVERGDIRQVYKLVAPKTSLIGQAQERKRMQQKKTKMGITIRRK